MQRNDTMLWIVMLIVAFSVLVLSVITLNVIIPERHSASYKWKHFIGLPVDNVYRQRGKFDSITATMSILGLINK